MPSSAKRVAYTASLVCVAMLLSYLESLLPYLPIPGFKPGLANLAVMVAYFTMDLPTAATVSLCRIALSSLLFGSPTTFLFSLCGGALSLAALALTGALSNRFFGALGVGMSCSSAHCIGQCLAAAMLYGGAILLSYLPWLLLLSIPTGALTGALTPPILRRLSGLKTT